jgi:plasmid maintenance system antidote protein VapI
MRKSPTFREAVRDWFLAANRAEDGSERFSASEIQRRTGVARTTQDRIIDMDADVDDETLLRLAGLLGGSPRVVKTLQLEPGALQQPRNALGWVAEAQQALEHAARLLRGQATEPPATKAGLLLAHEDLKREAKGQRPRGARRRKAG